ncbi:uncharacterized protein KNAG_0D03620 [Huiozyma naganishii CBS 8797]|uniref:Uncharacterized protein n=1 Tax=Huiozyma naganishii (strain ATCC MYA-139 / BCRC 22969 / CBS 8797 / KCTC 17520 / NBRC 10181 / NCYC 3082 / Yp74L-3) TaxID=1071383 RepID=J7RKS9_HUIN7|nr:hypothetical protein KNAG_0D03620 [Kazachstania naganishii CBS 8797]CCK70108.1 hypothetical protein KNAG_0D03620 [Kazachstania naganishii CBS 8797]
MIDGLKTKGLLKVGDAANLWKNRDSIGEDSLTTDVYVGAFQDMGAISCKLLINNLYKTFKNTILGLVVIDEFHNFETELSHRENCTRQLI